ncbi:MAG: hypothetical protein JNM35_12815 [Nitrospira sp.]|nr:hypothetical protein [Nitrospira sp.]MCS6265626.1 hypothetical protein [Nitrospira sp.]
MAALDLHNLTQIDAARYLALRASLRRDAQLLRTVAHTTTRAVYDEQPGNDRLANIGAEENDQAVRSAE